MVPPNLVAGIEADFRSGDEHKPNQWKFSLKFIEDFIATFSESIPSLEQDFQDHILNAKDSEPKKNNDDFFFGLATAPAHVEDKLEDSWVRFARSGHVASFFTAEKPEERLQFWTHPEVELDLAKETGVSVFRLGVDWARLVPTGPSFDQNSTTITQFDYQEKLEYELLLTREN